MLKSWVKRVVGAKHAGDDRTSQLADRVDVSAIRDHFDAAYYLSVNTDVAKAQIDPLRHYIDHGEKEGRRPRPDFDPIRLSDHFGPELLGGGRLFARAIADGYYLNGKLKLESPAAETGDIQLLHKHFDAAYYLTTNADVAKAQLDPLRHYIEYGEREGRRPHPKFDPVDAANQFGSHLLGGGRLFARAISEGYFDKVGKQKRVIRTEDIMDSIRSHFDAPYYLHEYRDVATGGIDPLRHYVEHGEREHRLPHPSFNPRDFRRFLSADEQASIKNLFAYFIEVYEADFSIFQEPRQRIPNEDAGIKIEPKMLAQAEDIREYFDEEHYKQFCPAAAQSKFEPILHYLAFGERRGFDPSPDFDVKYYLETNLDLKRAGISPFWHYVMHGRLERRSPAPYYKSSKIADPLVSVFVPNYNHARFLVERIASIFAQTYSNFELIVLDDRSSDDSISVIEQIRESSPRPFKTVYNETNSGNVFAQWQKAVGLARGELIWICESDDFCEPDFLERIVPHFRDLSVMLAFGRIQFCDAEGKVLDGMDQYRESAWPRMWGQAFKRPAYQWFTECLGVKNVIANVGGCVFRRQDVPVSTWDKARTYKIAGDWFLYSELAAGGAIAYEPGAVTYFRQHGQNTSASNFRKPHYYHEHGYILQHFIEKFGIPESTKQRFIDKIRSEYKYHEMDSLGYEFESLIPVESLLDGRQTKLHLHFGFLGFSLGGGEILPIHLANTFVARGYTVSMAAANLHSINEAIRDKLDRRIAIYDVTDVAIEGVTNYLRDRGINLVNSHVVNCDWAFHRSHDGPLPVPYVATLHGSHDVMDLTQHGTQMILSKIASNASAITYVARKNLNTFEKYDVDPDRFFHINNAVPVDHREFPLSRAELGISESAVIFTFVARGVERKGWRAAVIAFRTLLRSHPKEDIWLVLAGEGEKAQQAMDLVGAGEPIRYVGFQSAITGLYRLSDCAIVPTRYPGESNPLCLIEAVQAGLPIIATDTGEIRSMLTLDATLCGVLLDVQRDTQAFAMDLHKKMVAMLDKDYRAEMAAASRRLAPKFDINEMANAYEDVFRFAGLGKQDLGSVSEQR